MKTLADILLGLWLVLAGLAQLGGISFPNSGVVLALLAVVTGTLFFFADRNEKLATQLGSIVLGAWLLAGGLVSLFHVHVAGIGVLQAVLTLATGFVLVITRL